MRRVSVALARGIILAAVLFSGGVLSAPTAPPLDRALRHIRSQDFDPIFVLASARVQGYFSPAREDRFVEEVFSLAGKWKALTRARPSYERYVRASAERHLFNAAEFEAMLGQVRSDYAFHLAAADHRFLLLVHGDLRSGRPELTFEGLRARYDRDLSGLAPQVLGDLAMNAVSFAGSEAASMVLVSALTSSGILGGTAAAGTATGPWTSGAGLVAGILVGLVLDAALGEECEGAVRMQVHAQMEVFRNKVVEVLWDALLRALAAYRQLQEACARSYYEGGPDERLALRP